MSSAATGKNKRRRTALIPRESHVVRFLRLSRAVEASKVLGRKNLGLLDGTLGGSAFVTDLGALREAVAADWRENTPMLLNEIADVGAMRLFIDIDGCCIPRADAPALLGAIAKLVGATQAVLLVPGGDGGTPAPAARPTPTDFASFLMGDDETPPPSAGGGTIITGAHIYTDRVCNREEAIAAVERIRDAKLLPADSLDTKVYRSKVANLRMPLSDKSANCTCSVDPECDRCHGVGRLVVPNKRYRFHCAVGFEPAQIRRLETDPVYLLEQASILTHRLEPHEHEAIERMMAMTFEERQQLMATGAQGDENAVARLVTASPQSKLVQGQAVVLDQSLCRWFEAYLRRMHAPADGLRLTPAATLSSQIPRSCRWTRADKTDSVDAMMDAMERRDRYVRVRAIVAGKRTTGKRRSPPQTGELRMQLCASVDTRIVYLVPDPDATPASTLMFCENKCGQHKRATCFFAIKAQLRLPGRPETVRLQSKRYCNCNCSGERSCYRWRATDGDTWCSGRNLSVEDRVRVHHFFFHAPN